jgi:hypothetical protein
MKNRQLIRKIWIALGVFLIVSMVLLTLAPLLAA